VSIYVMNAVWEGFNEGGNLKLALLCLADYADDKGVAWPSMSKIARHLACSESQARRTVHRLVNIGCVEVIGNAFGGDPGSSRRYRIKLDRLTPGADATHIPGADATHTPGMDARNPLHGCAPTPGASDTLTTIEPPRTTIELPRTTKGGIAFAPPSWIRPEVWRGFEAMRNKTRKPMTDRARMLIIKKLETMKADGQDPDAVLEQSERNCWADVYPLKQSNANGSSTAGSPPETCARCHGSLVAGWTTRREGPVCNGCEARALGNIPASVSQ